MPLLSFSGFLVLILILMSGKYLWCCYRARVHLSHYIARQRLALEPNQWTWTVCPPVCCYRLHPSSLPFTKTVVTCKIKHLQKCFRAVDSPRLCRGRKNVVKMFYFTCSHLLCSTCVQHAKTFAKMF